MVDREFIVRRRASAYKPTDYTSKVHFCTSLIIATFCLFLVVRSYPGVQQSVSSRNQTSYTNIWVGFYWDHELCWQFMLVMKFTFRFHNSTFWVLFFEANVFKTLWLLSWSKKQQSKADYEAGTKVHFWGIISRLISRGTSSHNISVRGSTIPN